MMNTGHKDTTGGKNIVLRLCAFAALCFCCFNPLILRAAGEDLLMGSVVKSHNYKMDRVNNLEIFDGDVSFRNAAYDLKADHAVHDRKVSIWILRGSVYCMRKFLDGSNLEINCDNGKYSESFEKAELYRGKEPIRMKHLSADGKKLRGLCDRINADNAKAAMDFLGNFYLRTENMEIFSDNGFYSDTERSFLIYNSAPDLSRPKNSPKSAPVAIGVREGRDFAMTGEKMKFFRETGDVKLYNNVAGWIKAEKEPETKKKQ